MLFRYSVTVWMVDRQAFKDGFRRLEAAIKANGILLSPVQDKFTKILCLCVRTLKVANEFQFETMF